MTLFEQVAELKAVIKTRSSTSRSRRGPASADAELAGPRAGRWRRLDARGRLRLIAAALTLKPF